MSEEIKTTTTDKPEHCSPSACATCPAGCGGGCGGNSAYELDTSQGEFRTICVAILGAVAVYALFVIITGKRLGDYPGALVYGIFLAMVIVFWILAEKFKTAWRKKHPEELGLHESRRPIE